jgi:hypothetical protein
MTPVGVVINARSGRGRGKGEKLLRELRGGDQAHVQLLVLENFDDLAPGLQSLAAKGVRDLFISSGDGTIHAILTILAESGPFPALPRLCLLPHGTTSMTAADLGLRRKSISEQARFITSGTPRQTRRRHTIRVLNPKARGPLHGMFFGTGALTEATRYCQRAFNDRGVGGDFATFATLATALAKALLRPFGRENPNRFDRPYEITVKSEHETLCSGRNLLVLATTLDKLILGTRPFWGGATAPIRVTTMPYPIPRVVRWALPTLYGGEARSVPPGAVSRAVRACSILCTSPFVLDGEFYDPPQDMPLQLETGPDFEFIVG